MDAQSADGVLTISLAKRAETKPKQVVVKAAAGAGQATEAPKQAEAPTADSQNADSQK